MGVSLGLGVQQSEDASHELISQNPTCQPFRGCCSFLTPNSSEFGSLPTAGWKWQIRAARCWKVTTLWDSWAWHQAQQVLPSLTCHCSLQVSNPSTLPCLHPRSRHHLLSVSQQPPWPHSHSRLAVLTSVTPESQITNLSIHAQPLKPYSGFLLTGDTVHNHFQGLWGHLGSGPYSLSNQHGNPIPSSFQPYLLEHAQLLPTSALAPSVSFFWNALHCPAHLANPIRPLYLSPLPREESSCLALPHPHPLHSPLSCIVSLSSSSLSFYVEFYILGFVPV